jgi:hypothetical protein
LESLPPREFGPPNLARLAGVSGIGPLVTVMLVTVAPEGDVATEALVLTPEDVAAADG